MTREEAINTVRNIYQTDKEKEAIETLVPELAESEDEIHRKWVLEYLYDGLQKSDEQFKDQFKSAIAWLEKQKYNRMQPVYNNQESFESALDKAWKSYNDCGSRTVDSCEDDYIECAHAKGFREGYLFGLEKQKEQKPAEWSKNDTVFLNEITDFFENKTVKLQHDIDMYAHWLKSLPERFNLQPKMEKEIVEEKEFNEVYQQWVNEVYMKKFPDLFDTAQYFYNLGKRISGNQLRER